MKKRKKKKGSKKFSFFKPKGIVLANEKDFLLELKEKDGRIWVLGEGG